jgi:hypothetical protein
MINNYMEIERIIYDEMQTKYTEVVNTDDNSKTLFMEMSHYVCQCTPDEIASIRNTLTTWLKEIGYE